MSITQRFRKSSLIFSVAVTLVGFFVLIGWMGNFSILKSISSEWLSMKANAAVCFLLSGITLILVNQEKGNAVSKWTASFLSLIVFLTGTITFLEYVFGFNAGIDEILFKDEVDTAGGLLPGRQSLTSAAYFMLFGVCYLPGNNTLMRTALFQFLHITSGIVILAALMSYIYGAYVIVGISLESILVIHSTISFLLLILAVLFSQPEVGIMKQVSSDTSGGRIIRRTVPLFVIIFMLVGWLRLKGEEAGLYNEELGVSVFILVMIIIMGFLIFSNALSFTKSEVGLRQSEERLKSANEKLEIAEQQANLGHWEFGATSEFVHWSRQMFRLFELEPAARAPSMEEFLELIHPDDRDLIFWMSDQRLEQRDRETAVFRTNPARISLKYLLPTWQVIKDEQSNAVKYIGTLQDITERIEARNALKMREELFSKAFHSKVFGLAIVNRDRRLVDINETLANLIEFSREEMIGKTSLELGLTDPEYIKKRDELLLLLFQKGDIENYELDVITRTGKPLILLLSVQPLNLHSAPHWLISLVDITGKRKAEKELAESEYRLRTILEAEPECVKIVNEKGELSYMNRAGLAMIEAEDFEMVKGRKVLDLVNDPYKKDFDNLVASVYSGTPGRLEFEITGLKGTCRWMETHMVPLREEGKRITSLLSVTRDITERKKSEQQLIESEERLNRAEKMGSLGYGYYNAENDSMQLSAGLYEIFGVKPEEFLHTIEGLKSLIHPGDYLIQDSAFDTLVREGKAEVEFRIVRPDGEIRNVFFKTELTKNESGGYGNSFTTALDITERKKAEEQIKAYNDQLRQLTANLQSIREEERRRIGHELHDELGQLLTVLKLKIEQLHEIKHDKKKLDRSINEMIRQAEDCIKSSRKIATELRPSLLDDLGLIAALEWQASEFGRRTGIKTVFKSNLERMDLPPEFNIGIFRIFQESLTNVARHSRARNVTSNLIVTNEGIELKIADNGTGFDTSIIGSTKSLGLAGMKERASLMNGTYNIISNPNEGTEITVNIPLPPNGYRSLGANQENKLFTN